MSVPVPVTTRSRTLLFFSYRDSIPRSRRSRKPFVPSYHDDDDVPNADDDEHDRLIAASSSSHVVLDVADELPPTWVDLSDQVEDLLASAQAKIATLDKLHAKHVLPGFADRSQEEREIEGLAADITRDFRQCHTLIQRITAAHTFPPSRTPAQALRAAQNVQRALAAKVQELSGTFRKKQRVYMERLQGHAIKNQDILVASGAVRLRGSEGISAVEDDVLASESQTQTQLISDPTIAQRSHEITEIAKSIAQLAELFKDLSTLVIDQGTILDSVEYNVEQTAVNVEEAVKELNVAQTYQRNTGRRQCIFLLILLIIGAILLLIFKPRNRGGGGGAPADSTTTTTTTMALSPSPSAMASRSIEALGWFPRVKWRRDWDSEGI